MVSSDFSAIDADPGEGPELFESQRLLQRLVSHALDRGASDLFLLSDQDDMAVSIRRWGLVESLERVPESIGRQLINVAKSWAAMDLVERRRPMDGRIAISYHGRDVDIRINTIPTLYGEDATLRLLDPENAIGGLTEIGLGAPQRDALAELLNRPNGLILVCGPTGAGKTTTLYGCLSHLNDGSRKINTIEEPIEYSLPGVRQSQVNRAIGLGFAPLLASVLRQAPDVVMVGEVRDEETAVAAIRAANSGHLVLATLHAPAAAAAIPSLVALGAAPHFLASALAGVVAQRLVRRLCPRCRKAYELPQAAAPRIFGAPGCHACGDTSYVGRAPIAEVLTATGAVRELIAASRPVDEIHRQACGDGMISFHSSALAALSDGLTSIEEVVRVIPRVTVSPSPTLCPTYPAA